MLHFAAVGTIIGGYDRLRLWYDQPLRPEILSQMDWSPSTSDFYEHAYFHPQAKLYILTGRRSSDVPHAMIGINLTDITAAEAKALLISLGVDVTRALVSDVEARLDVIPAHGITVAYLSSRLLVDRIRHVDTDSYPGQTAYFGSRRSNRQVVNYDKALQAGWPHPCLRLESRVKVHRLWKLPFTEFLERGLPVNPFSGVRLVDTSWLDGRTLEARLIRRHGVVLALRSKTLSRYRRQRLRKNLLANVLLDLPAAFEEFACIWHTSMNGGVDDGGNIVTVHNLHDTVALPDASPVEPATSNTTFTTEPVPTSSRPDTAGPELQTSSDKRTTTARCALTPAAIGPRSNHLFASATPRFPRGGWKLQDKRNPLQAFRPSRCNRSRYCPALQTPLGRWVMAGPTTTEPNAFQARLPSGSSTAGDSGDDAMGEKLVTSLDHRGCSGVHCFTCSSSDLKPRFLELKSHCSRGKCQPVYALPR